LDSCGLQQISSVEKDARVRLVRHPGNLFPGIERLPHERNDIICLDIRITGLADVIVERCGKFTVFVRPFRCRVQDIISLCAGPICELLCPNLLHDDVRRSGQFNRISELLHLPPGICIF
jgi:hypothetical protein